MWIALANSTCVAEVNVEDVPAAGVVGESAASVADDDDAEIFMDLLCNLLDTCTTLTRRVKNLEHDKIAQVLEITKLKQRVKKLEKRNKLKVLKLMRLKKVGTAQRVETSDDAVMDDVSKQGRIIADMDADVDVTLKDISKDVAVDDEIKESVDVQGRQAEPQAQICGVSDGIKGSSTAAGTSSSATLAALSPATPAAGTSSTFTSATPSSTCYATIIPSKSGVSTPEKPFPTLLMLANTFCVRAGEEYLVECK
uniref:Uncharacterized protein n=1 Tax=Tanacetum cinerariifolium TaxID=118510 RepID=A0A699L851_TANCI|nr:hypothetical protein [Tanacetum cinerariifolium]